MIVPRFRTLLLEAIDHFATAGYASPADLQEWVARLHAALDRELLGDPATKALVTQVLTSVYNREIRLGIGKRVPGVSRYTLDRVAPQLRAELDRRIFAGVDLIRLNKRAATEKTLQRFSGWVSSVPPGGSGPAVSKREVARDVGKSVARLKFEARRVAIDMGHKLSSAVSATVAMGEGAIAATWMDRGAHDKSYNARPEHLARSGKLFLVRNSWAISDGLIKKGGLMYTDEIEQPAELPYCSCTYTYVVSPRALPPELLTAKGRLWVTGESRSKSEARA